MMISSSGTLKRSGTLFDTEMSYDGANNLTFGAGSTKIDPAVLSGKT